LIVYGIIKGFSENEATTSMAEEALPPVSSDGSTKTAEPTFDIEDVS